MDFSRVLNWLAACLCRKAHQDVEVQVEEFELDQLMQLEDTTRSSSSGDALASGEASSSGHIRRYKYMKGNKIVMPREIPPRFPKAVARELAEWFEFVDSRRPDY
jgi:hypothetical protein